MTLLHTFKSGAYQLLTRFKFQKNEYKFQNSKREILLKILFKTLKFIPLDADTCLHTFRKL